MSGTLKLPSRSLAEQTYFSMTKSLCRVCRKAVDAKIVFRGEEVFLDKFCPTHGKEDVLVSSSVDWYLDALSFIAPASPPFRPVTATTEAGCPFDCGPCASHQQRVFLPVIPITSACNMSCPVCYTVNRNVDAYALSGEGLGRLLERLVEDGTGRDILNFTGGEPTLHPDLLGLLRRSRDAGFRQLTVSTNGLRLLDEAYVTALAELDARIVLSLDTFRPATDKALVGADTVEAKLKALDLLGKHGVATTILPAVARGHNDDEVGALLDLVLSRPHILSLELHTLAFTGQGATGFEKAARITIPDLHARLADATGGKISALDFVPSPLAHPHCYSICYLLCLDGGGFIPLTRLMPRARLFDLLGTSLYLSPREELEEVFREMIDTVWAEPERFPEPDSILLTLRRLLSEIYPENGRALPLEVRQKRAERSIKAIYIHSHMDEASFDVGRVMKCCVGVPEEDGTFIPTCSYNVLHREKDPRFTSPERVAAMQAAREAR